MARTFVTYIYINFFDFFVYYAVFLPLLSEIRSWEGA